MVPVTVKVATKHPPGVVVTVLVPGDTLIGTAEGERIITTPDPPWAPAGASVSPPPPPPPRLVVPTAAAPPGSPPSPPPPGPALPA